MRVVEITTFGGPEVLKIADRPLPELRDDEVLIEVEAAGVSRPDVLQRRGHYAPPSGASDIPGLEVAGVVAEVGASVSGYGKGDRVCALVAGGGYAEMCAAPAVQVLPIPETWSAIEASTLPENIFTVYDMLVRRMRLGVGETILIHGGTSGIGSTAVMLSRALGAIPIVTVGSEKKCAAALAFGAQHAIDYKSSDFVAEVKLFTDGRGVDAVLDIVGGDYLGRNLDALAVEGKIGMLAAQSGAASELPVGKLLYGRATIFGASMRARSTALKGEIARDLLRHVWPLLPAKSPIQAIVDSTYPFERAAEAHARMESSEHIGKIVLTV
jgi:NADPH:quinone reductase